MTHLTDVAAPRRGSFVPQERISVLDVDRGIAILGTLSAVAPGLADKPRRRWYAGGDLGVAPFVVRTGVN